MPRKPPAREPAPAGTGPPATVPLLAGVGALLGLRVVAALWPGRAWWGADLGRDLPPAMFVAGVAATALACLPAVARPLARLLPARAGAAWALAGAALLALFAWAHPDRALYNGDTRLRQGTFVTVADPRAFAPQALPGDLWLHHTLPRELARRTPIPAGDVARGQGALAAFATALAGWALARACGAAGPAALAAAAVMCGTAALALETGYAKASVEVAALTAFVAVGGVRAARGAGGLGISGLALAAALPLHRSALALVPAWLLVALLDHRRGAPRGVTAWLGLLLPPALLLALGPGLARIVTGFDREHHLAGWDHVLSPAHLADLGNTLLLLFPLAPLVPLLLLLRPRPTRRELAMGSALALPPLAVLLGFAPQQGLPRDWDVFAFAGVALAAIACWRVALVLTASSGARAASVALALAALVPALQWAWLQSDTERAWSRAEAVLLGPPPRPAEERALGLATLGLMRYDRGQHEAARRLFRLSAEAEPHPRRMVEWGTVARLAGEHREALAWFERAAALKPDLASAWQGVLESAGELADAARVHAAVEALERLEPDSPLLPEARDWLDNRDRATGPPAPAPADPRGRHPGP